jgi:Serine/threonine protein kinase
MGSVFKAYDHTLERMVALKVLRPEMSAGEEERAKLEQEARVTALVNHPHVVRVYSFGEASGQFYLAMELVEKGSLDDLVALQTRVSEAQVLGIGAQIAQGLEAAAEKGLIHRDVKPGNILFSDAQTTKIVDFGLARVLEDEAGRAGKSGARLTTLRPSD